MLSNCLFFALALLVRRRGRKRGLVLRHSRLGSSVPHIIYIELRHYGWREVHFVPEDKRPKSMPPPVFRGHSKWGDT